MPYIDPNDFGPLAPLVKNAGYIIAVGGMLLLLFKGRGSWHPIDESIPKVSQKTAILISGVLVAIAYYWLRDEASAANVTWLAMVILITLLISFPLFIWVNARYVYEMPYAIATGNTGEQPRVIKGKVAGGRLTDAAQKLLTRRTEPVPISRQLEGCDQQIDLVFDHNSRAAVRTVLQCVFVVFIVSTLVFLALGALLLTHVQPV